MTREHMRGFLLTGHGDLGRLEFHQNLPVPTPGPDEVLIEVAACGMNNTDVNTRVGWYSREDPHTTGRPDGVGSWSGRMEFPRIQGADPVGRVTAVGVGGDTSIIGERVIVDPWIRSPDGDLAGAEYLGSERDGGFASFVKVPAVNAHRIDSPLTDVELASFPCSYSTAEHMLQRAGVTSGQWVLVTGASGGVGGALVQLAKRRDARVIAVTSTPKTARVRDLGADIVLDRAVEDLAGRVMRETGGVRVFADVVGGDLFPSLFETIERGGHYATAGAIAGPMVSLDLRTLYLNDLTMHGATVVPADVFVDLVTYIENGEIRPIVAATYPLEQLREAQEAFERKAHVGAIVIEVAPEGTRRKEDR